MATASTTSNPFPKGQCTWYADERYHQITGVWVPWLTDAYLWASAAKNAKGWNVAAQPPKNTTSIICIQPGIQTSDSTYGHVGIVESINSDGSVVTSDLNWGASVLLRAQVTQVIFKTGSGVSFIWYSGAASTGIANNLGNIPQQTDTTITGLSNKLLDQVHATLISNDGFYGIALAIDQAEQLPGWVDLTTGPLDMSGLIRSVGATATDNIVPIGIRFGLVSLGAFIIMLLITKVVIDVGESGIDIASKIAPLAALAA